MEEEGKEEGWGIFFCFSVTARSASSDAQR